MTEQNYVVVENTPGYLPEDTDPFVGTYEECQRALEYQIDELRSAGYSLDSAADDYSWATFSGADWDSLGRVLEILPIED